MPELPEAEIVARQVRDRLLGAELEQVRIGRTDIIRQGFHTKSWYRGARLESVDRYGKSVALGFRKSAETRYLVAELGMTGLLLFQAVAIKHPQHIHAEMFFTGGREPVLRYWNPRRFGRLSLLDRTGLDRYVSRRFGLDPLTMSREEFARFLGPRRARLKSLLMQQQVVAGIGNIYANEILFRAGLHPDQLASRLRPAQMELLYDTTRTVLLKAIDCGGSSVRDFFAPDGTEGGYKGHHLVYGKDGQACPNLCGQSIKRLQRERSSFFCPVCQGRRRKNLSPLTKPPAINLKKSMTCAEIEPLTV